MRWGAPNADQRERVKASDGIVGSLVWRAGMETSCRPHMSWGRRECSGGIEEFAEVVGLSYPHNCRKSHLIVSIGKHKAAMSKMEMNRTSK